MSSAWNGLVNNEKITELPHYAINKNLPADSYFTTKETAEKCLSILMRYLQINNINVNEFTFIEPGAGSGNFYDILPHNDKIGIDLINRRKDIINSDFLTWYPKEDDKKYISIGNPPFGVRGAIALAFVNRCFLFSEYVAFILPMSFHSNGKGSNMKRVVGGHLVVSEILEGEKYYSPDNNKEIKVNTLFQIWKKGEGEGLFKNYDVSEYVDIYTVCSSPDRLCGLDKIGQYDFYVSSSFFGNELSTVYDFSHVKYGSGYGVIIKKNKEEILKKLKKIEWNNYSSLATNSCKHVRIHNIEECLYDLGYGIMKK
jgi:hypothetical protein